MTTKQYLAALKKLGMQPQAKATAQALGLSVRQLARLAAGAPISGTLARLLDVLRAHHPVSPPQP